MSTGHSKHEKFMHRRRTTNRRSSRAPVILPCQGGTIGGRARHTRKNHVIRVVRWVPSSKTGAVNLQCSLLNASLPIDSFSQPLKAQPADLPSCVNRRLLSPHWLLTHISETSFDEIGGSVIVIQAIPVCLCD